MTKKPNLLLVNPKLNRKREEAEVFFVGYIGDSGKNMPLNPSVSVSSFSLYPACLAKSSYCSFSYRLLLLPVLGCCTGSQEADLAPDRTRLSLSPGFPAAPPLSPCCNPFPLLSSLPSSQTQLLFTLSPPPSPHY